MIRSLALSLLLVPCLGLGQGVAKIQKDRTKALDAAALTPFFTKKGSDAVKRVITGADERKDDEKLTDPLNAKGSPSLPTPGGQAAPGGKPAPGQPGQPGQPQAPQTPAAEPSFAWRLVGISYGKHQGMALFQSPGQNKTVQNGAVLDSETKILSITRSRVVVVFHGKRLELSPW